MPAPTSAEHLGNCITWNLPANSREGVRRTLAKEKTQNREINDSNDEDDSISLENEHLLQSKLGVIGSSSSSRYCSVNDSMNTSICWGNNIDNFTRDMHGHSNVIGTNGWCHLFEGGEIKCISGWNDATSMDTLSIPPIKQFSSDSTCAE